jgi:hypothetical protein
MTEAEQIMKRCQVGTRNYDEANNLHADCYRVIGKLLKTVAELESQEPVAWRIKVETKLRDGSLDVGYQPRNEKMSAYDEPLYTHPQRTWVGLTDEEENEYNYLGPDMHWVIQEIAAKLKEKNTWHGY